MIFPKPLIILLFTVLALSDFSGQAIACAQGRDLIQIDNLQEFLDRPAPAPEGFRFALEVKADVARRMSLEEMECWISYLYKRREILSETKPEHQFEVDAVVLPEFEEEYHARLALRKGLNQIYGDLCPEQKTYVDSLNKVQEAGYLADYVFRFHHRDHWDEYSGELERQTEKFDEWANANLKNHKGIHFGDLVAYPGNRARAIGIFVDNKQIAAAEGAAWLNYALLRFEFLRENGTLPKVLVDEVILPSFEEETKARQSFYEKRWESIREILSEESRASFEAMKAADEAGFAKEFVWVYCNQPHWEQPEELRLDNFKTWATENIPDHPEKAPTFSVLYGRDVQPEGAPDQPDGAP